MQMCLNPNYREHRLHCCVTSLLHLQVVQRVLAELNEKYNLDQTRPVIGFVRLTGLAHTEDVVAFREIARQLCK